MAVSPRNMIKALFFFLNVYYFSKLRAVTCGYCAGSGVSVWRELAWAELCDCRTWRLWKAFGLVCLRLYAHTHIADGVNDSG